MVWRGLGPLLQPVFNEKQDRWEMDLFQGTGSLSTGLARAAQSLEGRLECPLDWAAAHRPDFLLGERVLCSGP